MNESDDMLIATRKALALLAHAIGATGDARPLLANLMANYRAQVKPDQPADTFDALATGMLLSLSSLALKQHPNDPETRRLYQDLRPGQRH
jgi:hypothetical protein